MLVAPRKVKRRKQHRGRMKGCASTGTLVSFGEYGLKVLESCMLTGRHLETIRVSIVRTVRKGAKIWFRVFPDYPYTRKPAETRMGKGKGDPEKWVARILPGTVLVEISGVSEELALKALTKLNYKLGVKTKIVKRIRF